MILDFGKLNPSDYAAWWGATVATIALIWNIVVSFRSGARVHVSATAGMHIFPPEPHEKDKTYILVNAVNVGTSATTITNFCGYSANTFWDLFSKNKQQHFIVKGATGTLSIPFKLSPGDEWRGTADQTLILEDFKGKYFYIGIVHNQKKIPIYKRVRLNA